MSLDEKVADIVETTLWVRHDPDPLAKQIRDGWDHLGWDLVDFVILDCYEDDADGQYVVFLKRGGPVQAIMIFGYGQRVEIQRDDAGPTSDLDALLGMRAFGELERGGQTWVPERSV